MEHDGKAGIVQPDIVPDSRRGTVNMRYSTAQPFSDLYIRNLSGNNALFMVDTDIENDQSDRIIMETATGAHKIDVRATVPNRHGKR